MHPPVSKQDIDELISNDLEIAFLLQRANFIFREMEQSGRTLPVNEILTLYDDIIRLNRFGYVFDSTKIDKLLEERGVFAPPITQDAIP